MGELTSADAAAIAKSIVVALAGGRWVSPPVRMVDKYPIPSSGRVILAGRPVATIHSVKVDGTTITTYELNGHVLSISGSNVIGSSLCGGGREVEIDYTYGVAALPPQVQRAVDVLANELLLADSNSPDCRIPERVQSVSRQGVSWTMIDPQDFLDKGRTGIYEVDMLIRAVNPSGAKRRVRVFSPVASAIPIRRQP